MTQRVELEQTSESTQAPPVMDWGGQATGVRRRKTREEKHEEALRRRERSGLLKRLKKTCEEAETRVQTVEEQLSAFRAEQSQNDHYLDGERVAEVARSVARLESELEDAVAAWEEAALALENAP